MLAGAGDANSPLAARVGLPAHVAPRGREQPHPGAVIDHRYGLEQELSRGGMGNVFRARHYSLGRSVAIKFVHADLREEVAMRRQFLTEAQLAASLNHPHIVAVTDFGLDHAFGHYLVMELLDGETLHARMAGQRLPLRVACDILHQAVSAVRYIHGRHIIHGDLKPDNLFLVQLDYEPRRRNHVKLIDFGLSCRLRPTSGVEVGVLAGTPPYLAPERFGGGALTSACDIYAVGAIFYRMVTGQPPYRGSAIEVARAQVAGTVPPPPSSLIPEPIDPGVDDLTLRCLALQPADRPASAAALQLELEQLMAVTGTPARSSPRRRRSPRSSALDRPRAHPRVQVEASVIVSSHGLRALGLTANLSLGGAFVLVHPPPPVGTRVRIELRLPEVQRPLLLAGAVRWSRDGARAGCGIEWRRLSRSARAALVRYVASSNRTTASPTD